MKNPVIETMINRVASGLPARKVFESSLSLHPGTSARVIRNTTATEANTNAEVAVTEGTIVTIYGVGGGVSGADHACRLPDGRNVTIPFMDLTPHGRLGESTRGRKGKLSEQLTGAVAKVTLSKPLPQSAVDWLEGGFADHAVQLPDVPSDDSAASMTFLMKANDDETLNSALDALKKLAGASFKSSTPASMVDWSGVSVG